jgi:hypothetical protein
MNFEFYRDRLREAGVIFEPGLTDSELQRAEEAYSLTFPPDLAAFLQFGLPVSERWPNWRELNNEGIERMLNWPYEGLCFDIENAGFWLTEWGSRPSSLADAFAIARTKLDEAPKLIPVCGHRYLPSRPNAEGNPVFSVYQTDIIYYGSNLWNYFENEFYDCFGVPNYRLDSPIRRIEFWSDLI